MTNIVINGSFWGQRITGQQRYAVEIMNRLAGRDGVSVARPGPRTSASSARSWAWSQTLALQGAKGAVLLSMTSRVPVIHGNHVVVVHDLFPLTNPEWYSAAYVATHAPVLKRSLRSARGLVAVSAQTKDRLEDWMRPGTPVVVAPNGVSGLLGAHASLVRGQRVLDLFSLRRGKFLLAVGSMDPRKNFAGLVEGYRMLPTEVRSQYPLAIVGGTAQGVFRSDSARVATGARELGYVSDEELAVLYAAATGFVSPSLDEGFGIPLIEAAAAGAPVALSDIPIFRWVYGDGAQYFDPNDPGEVARALSGLIRSPPDGNFLHSKAASIANRFSWDASAQVIYDFCISLSDR